MKHTLALPIALFLAPLAVLHATGAPAKKPNILYVLTDQWRGNATGYAGDPNVKTPNIDQLAKEGLNYRNVVSVCPVCTPHRAALMTGRFPTSTGMFLNDAYLPSEELCMAEILQGAGYATGYIGKWHLDGHGRESFIPPERRQGWDYWKGNECTHTYNHSAYFSGNDPEKKYWDGYDGFAQTKDAQSYLKAMAAGGQPFILLISFGAPHFPHATAPEEYKKLYPSDQLKLPPMTTPDILPTLLGLAGVPIPKSVEGDDLSGTVRNPKFAEDRAALYEGVATFASLGKEGEANKKEYRAIRTSRYTYVCDLKGPWLLYDDDADPFQINNLANKQETEALQKELDAKLQVELKKRGDEFRNGQYYLDLWGYDIKQGGSVPYEPGAPVQSPKHQASRK